MTASCSFPPSWTLHIARSETLLLRFWDKSDPGHGRGRGMYAGGLREVTQKDDFSAASL